MSDSEKSVKVEGVTGELPFNRLNGKKVKVAFDEPNTSSDGGAVLLREAAEQNSIIEQLAAVVKDQRDSSYVQHTLEELFSQRVVQICQGYEDACDCNSLKDDPAIKMATGGDPLDQPLSSQSTMTRLENNVGIRDLIRMGYVLLDNFLDSYNSAPEMIVIDMDPTPNRTYGDQQMSLFNTHYGGYCLMPFHVYEGLTGKLITTVIRPGKTPTDKEILAILKRIKKRIRARFPDTKLLLRADSHHTKPAVLDWLEENGVDYVLGMATNNILKRRTAGIEQEASAGYERTLKKYRRFHSFGYSAGTWSRWRRIISRTEASAAGMDTRFVVTSLEQTGAKYLYETVYSARGNAELFIKEHKSFLYSARTSCNTKEANQFRLFLHSAAYVIMHNMREKFLQGTELANKTFGSIRLRLLKLAARVEVGKTYVRLHLPAAAPVSHVFAAISELVTAPDTS